jgi:hypothetical protein
MSDDKKLTLLEGEPATDLSQDDAKKVQLFKDEGAPGIATLEEPKLHKIMDLYLSGKSYRQISQALRIDKTMIMYLADRFNWYLMRREYLNEMEHRQMFNLMESKIEDKNFLLELTHMWRRKMGSNISKYLQTDDERFANEIDLKVVDRYMKAVDIIHKLSYDGKSEGKPTVGLNLGDGVVIKKKSDNEVEITPKQKTIKDALRQFADMRREEEQKARQKPVMIEEGKGDPSNDENQ